MWNGSAVAGVRAAAISLVRVLLCAGDFMGRLRRRLIGWVDGPISLVDEGAERFE